MGEPFGSEEAAARRASATARSLKKRRCTEAIRTGGPTLIKVIFDVITIFPEFFKGPFDYGIIRRGREKGLIEIGVHDLRDFTSDRHRTVVAESETGSVAAFPPPHQFFFPRDLTENLSNGWFGTGHRGLGSDRRHSTAG